MARHTDRNQVLKPTRTPTLTDRDDMLGFPPSPVETRWPPLGLPASRYYRRGLTRMLEFDPGVLLPLDGIDPAIGADPKVSQEDMLAHIAWV
jgi:hypothetical protein